MTAAASASGTVERPGAWNRLSIGQKRLVWVWTFLALPVVFYVVIRFYPTVQAFWLSFTDWDLLRPAKFIGAENYVELYNDPLFWQVFRNTFAYLIIGTPISSLSRSPWPIISTACGSCTVSYAPFISCRS